MPGVPEYRKSQGIVPYGVGAIVDFPDDSLMAAGLDQVTAISAVVACLNNQGVGAGEVAIHYGGAGDVALVTLSLVMVLGRFDMFAFLLMLAPSFWLPTQR